MLPALLYKRPYGRYMDIEITNVSQNDAEYLNSTNVKVSLEDIGPDTVIYFDYGAKTEDGEPDELIEFAKGRTCQNTIRAAVAKIKEIRGHV